MFSKYSLEMSVCLHKTWTFSVKHIAVLNKAIHYTKIDYYYVLVMLFVCMLIVSSEYAEVLLCHSHQYICVCGTGHSVWSSSTEASLLY